MIITRLKVTVMLIFMQYKKWMILLLIKVIAFDEGERKPNFVFASCVFWVGVPVYGYAELFEIAVRTPK